MAPHDLRKERETHGLASALAGLAALLLAASVAGPWYAGPAGAQRGLETPGTLLAGGAALLAGAAVAWSLLRRPHLAQAAVGLAALLVVLLTIGAYVHRLYIGVGWTLFAWGFYAGAAGALVALAAYFTQPTPSAVQYVVRRVLLSAPVLLGVTLITFTIAWAANEGHMERGYLTDKMTPAQRERIVEQYGFDEPWYVQYFLYLQRLARLDLGLSHAQNDRPVLDVYAEFLPATFELTMVAMVIAIAGGVFLGTLSAVRKDAPVDHATRFLALAGVSVPIFWLGLLLKFAFATQYPVEQLVEAGILGKGVFLALLVGLPLVAGLFVAEALLTEDLPWRRLAVNAALVALATGLLLWAGWTFAALVVLAVGGVGLAVAAVLRWRRLSQASRRVWQALMALSVVAGFALAATPVANAVVTTFFDLVPDFPLGGRFSNRLVAVPGAHPSLTEGPTRMLLVDTALARDWEAFSDVLLHLALPGVTLGYASLAIIARMMRSSMLEVLSLDFVRTARAKGLPRSVVVERHARRNALIPIATVIGLTFGSLLSGAVLTETIFQWPGLGRWSTNAIVAFDTNSIMAFTLLVVVIYLLANLVVDLMYSILDPRVRLS